MKLLAGRPFWPLRDGLPSTYPPLQNDASCEVLVIGAGITGALVANELARRGYDVVALDRRDAVMGSTAASTALLLYEVDPEFAGLRKTLGMKSASETYLRMAHAVHGLAQLSKSMGAGEFASRPSLYFASRKAHVSRLRREYLARKRLGLEVEWVGARELRAEYGCRRPAAIRSQGQGHIDPYAFTHGLLNQFPKRLRVHDRTAVKSIEYRPNGIRARTDRRCTVEARQVVFATGYETQLHERTFPTRLYSTYAFVSEPGVELWEDHAMLWETNRPYLYGRCTDDGRVLFGGYNDAYRGNAGRDAAVKGKVLGIQRAARRMFPNLEFEVAFGWGGTFAETRDGLPYVGPDPKHANAHFVLGYGANGTVFAYVGAQLVADQIEGVPNTFKAFQPSKSDGKRRRPAV